MRRGRPASLTSALATLAIATVIACRPAPAPLPPERSYYPLQLGERWSYDTTFYGPNQRSTTTIVAVCRLTEGKVGRTFLISTCADDELSEAQIVVEHGDEIAEPVIFNGRGEARQRDPPEVIARPNLQVGQVWQWRGTVGDDERSSLYTVANRGRVLTPMGELEAIRLLVEDGTAGPSRAAVERWYAPGIGMVKEAGAVVFPTDDGFAMLELVRNLREHGVVSVETIPCCGKTPAELGAPGG